jgi:tetrahydromethanopterin S-methyltransferase subunit G
MPDRERPSLMLPATDEGAPLTLILEMLRGIDRQLESQNSAATKDREVLHDIASRVDRIERNQLERKVRELAEKVDSLESERDQRRGVTLAAEWIGRFGTPIILLIASIVTAIVYFRTH